MKVLLKENVANCGAVGDEVVVKPGYARNYLIPKNKALLINKENHKRLTHQRKLIEEKRQKNMAELKSIADKIARTEINFVMKAAKKGKLFGSVSAKQILDELAKNDIKIDKNLLTLNENLKTPGLFKLPVKLHPSVKTEITVKIEADYGKEEVAEEAEKNPLDDENKKQADDKQKKQQSS